MAVNSVSRPRTKTTQLVVLTVLFAMSAPCLLCVGAGLLAPNTHTMHVDRPFDHDAWPAFEYDDATGFSSRLPMAASLVRKGTLDRMTREEVEALLGPPDHETWSGPYPYPGWEVGRPDDAGSSDSTGLMVEFDADGRVTNVHTPGF